ncbi:MAG TPA: hypothetical protein VL988_11555 [Solirubrobacteraceae bacterium]|nr:hypothetical protein [Solirubrobacteraceae bacterium]
MSAEPQRDQSTEQAEVAGALPVLAGEARVIDTRAVPRGDVQKREATMPAVQAAAVAAGGFVAGAAVVGLVTRRQRAGALARGRGSGRRLARGRRRSSGSGELVQIVGSRSLLLDVHLLGGRD